MPKAPPYLYEKLTWPEIADAVRAGKVPVVPVGSIEQHGPHLPLDVDCVLPRGVALRAAERLPEKILVLPTIVHGYTAHVMDFPGTINIHYTTFIAMLVDVGKSLAYHGFKKIVFLNGHGSNMPNLDLAARRVNLETDAECAFCAWWSFLTVDPEFLPRWRESRFPGGCAHACELETSAYLYLDGENVRREKIADGEIAFHQPPSKYRWVDLFGSGPAAVTSWTSSYSQSGVLGEATKASAEKGRQAIEEAAQQLAKMVEEFSARPKDPRTDHHAAPPTMKMPWDAE